MLYVYFENPLTFPVIENVEYEFSMNGYAFDETDQKLVKAIEQGELVGNGMFRDRFGYCLHLDDMSTGSKAAIITNHTPDRLVDLRECGINAKSAILSFCRWGNILMEYPEAGLLDYTGGSDIDVFLENHRFTSMDDLMYYISDGRLLEHFG